MPNHIRFPFKELSHKVFYELTPDVEEFLKWLRKEHIDQKQYSFGVYLNNGRYKINTDAYLEIDLSDERLDLHDVFRAYFR